jgi:PIN domain nuclease of toxin-antitoxin system
MNYFTRYQTNNRSSLDIFQTFEIIINKTQGKLSEAIRAMTCFDTLARVQACSEAAINLALIVDAIEQGALEGNPQDILKLKRICALFVEMISRANIQEDSDLATIKVTERERRRSIL